MVHRGNAAVKILQTDVLCLDGIFGEIHYDASTLESLARPTTMG